ncbi:MAG: hypothetical protein IT350_07980 [Deltaproteobacteria bacterium]|nr:hypothetical protein [Deltaproteobacteria bacterium]
MKSLIDKARRIFAIPTREPGSRRPVADTESVGIRELFFGGLDVRTRWARWLPATLIVCALSSFVSWGREYVVGGLWLAGSIALAIGFALLPPLAIAAIGRWILRRIRRHPLRADDPDRVLAWFGWLARSLAWGVFACFLLTVLLSGPTVRACLVCVLVGREARRGGMGAAKAIFVLIVVALLIRVGFSEPGNPSTFGDAATWVGIATLLGVVLIDDFRPWFELGLRVLTAASIFFTILALLIFAPAMWSASAVAAVALVVWRLGGGASGALIAGATATIIAVIGHPAQNRMVVSDPSVLIHWLAVSTLLGVLLLTNRLVGRYLAGSNVIIRKAVAVAVVFSIFGLAQDWGRTPTNYRSTPPVPCTSFFPIASLPEGERSGPHKIYDIKLMADGRTLLFCDKFGRRIGRLDLETGTIQWSERLDMLPERLLVDESAGRVIAFLKEPLPIRPAATAEFDLESLSRIRACPMGRWVDIAPSGRTGRFVAIQEMVGKIYEMDMESCGIHDVGIGTMLPYDLTMSDANQHYFVSGWFYSSILSRVDRYPHGAIGEARAAWLGPFSLGMASDDPQRSLFVARPTAWAIDVMDMDTLTRRRRLPALPWIRAVASAPEVGLLFTANFFSGQVIALDSRSGDLVATWQGPEKEARTMVWDAGHRRLYVTGRSEIVRCELDPVIAQRGSGPGS